MRLSKLKIGLLCVLSGINLGTSCVTMSPYPIQTVWTQNTVNNTIPRPTAVEAADFDADTRLDIVAGYTDGTTGSVHIYFQTAANSFTPVQVGGSADLKGLAALAVADMDADGHKDIIAACNGQIVYLHSPSDPTQSAGWTASIIAESSGTGIAQWNDVVVANIDSNSGVDLYACNANTGRLCWFRSPGDPSSGTGWVRVDIDATTRSGAAALVAEDVDSDGRVDVISTAPGETSARIAWYKNPSTPSIAAAWTKNPIGNLAGVARVTVGDLNKDGRSDIAVTSTTTRQIVWYAKPSTVTDTWTGYQLAVYTTNIPTGVKVTDVDGNGQLDVVVSTQTVGSLRWFTPIGTQTLGWGENNLHDLSEAALQIIIADIDSDGHPDVVAALQGTTTDLDNVSWLKNPQ